jgi:hypothetical protein
MKLLEFLKDYWAQLTLIIAAIGFLFQSVIGAYLKVREIRFKTLHENRLSSIGALYKSYLDLEIKLGGYYNSTMYGTLEKEQKLKIQNEIALGWRNFMYDFKLCRIFVFKKDIELLEKVQEELEEIHNTINHHWIDREYGAHDSENFKKLTVIREEIFPKRLPELFRQLEKSLRDSYQMKWKIF